MAKSFICSIRSFFTRAVPVAVSATIISVACAAGIASAATTISTDISTGGQLTVTGTSTLLGVVSIGSSTPAGNTLFSVGTSSPLLFVDENTGNVGIGINNPSSKLSVSGDIYGLNQYGGIAVGSGNVATSTASVAFGYHNSAGGAPGAVAIGLQNTATAYTSAAIGLLNTTTGSNAVAIGEGIHNNVNNSLMIGASDYTKMTMTNNSSNPSLPGEVGIGSSSPVANFQVANGTNATTTVELGSSGQSKGTCIKLYRSDGSAIYASVAAGATTFTLSTTACASVAGF